MSKLVQNLLIGGAELSSHKYAINPDTHTWDPVELLSGVFRQLDDQPLGFDLAQAYAEGVALKAISAFEYWYPSWKPFTVFKVNADVEVKDIEHARNIRKEPFDVLMLHNQESLKKGKDLLTVTYAIEHLGCAKAFGVSIYDQEYFDLALEHPAIEHIQIPFNILNTRFLDNGSIQKAQDKGIKIHLRSILLGGLLTQYGRHKLAEQVSSEAKKVIDALESKRKDLFSNPGASSIQTFNIFSPYACFTIQALSILAAHVLVPNAYYIVGFRNRSEYSGLVSSIKTFEKELDCTKLEEFINYAKSLQGPNNSWTDPRNWPINRST